MSPLRVVSRLSWSGLPGTSEKLDHDLFDIFQAAKNGHLQITKNLVQSTKIKVEINAISNEGKTALNYALDETHPDIVKVLRANGGRKASKVRG